MIRHPREFSLHEGAPYRRFGRLTWPAQSEPPSASPLASYTPRAQSCPTVAGPGDTPSKAQSAPSPRERADVSPDDALVRANTEVDRLKAELAASNAQLERLRTDAAPMSRAQIAKAGDLVTAVNASIDRLTVRVGALSAGTARRHWLN